MMSGCAASTRIGYLDLILVIGEVANEESAFRIESWGYTRYHNSAVYEELKAVWRNMSRLIDHVIRDQFSASTIRMLSPAKVDAEYAGTRLAE